jgi:hypothetical protein
MSIRLVLRPGSRGTRKLLAQYGKRLVCVRYRYDARLQRRYKTVELIVDEVEWKPRSPKVGRMVHVRLLSEEDTLRDLVIDKGGSWDAKKRAWRIRIDDAIGMGLRNRIIN